MGGFFRVQKLCARKRVFSEDFGYAIGSRGSSPAHGTELSGLSHALRPSRNCSPVSRRVACARTDLDQGGAVGIDFFEQLTKDGENDFVLVNHCKPLGTFDFAGVRYELAKKGKAALLSQVVQLVGSCNVVRIRSARAMNACYVRERQYVHQ